MPTPIDLFLRQEKEGDAELQLGASQDWDWKNSRFNGFVDRDLYLRRVAQQLLVETGAEQPSRSNSRLDLEDYKRRQRLLLSLQSVLQSRRLKNRIVQEQISSCGLPALQQECWESSKRLGRVWYDPYGRAAFSLSAICSTLKQDILHGTVPQGDETDPWVSSVFGISNDPSQHIYPAAPLQKMLYVARPLCNDAVFHCTPPTSERTRWMMNMKTKQKLMDYIKSMDRTSCQFCLAGRCEACANPIAAVSRHKCANLIPDSPCIKQQQEIDTMLFDSLVDTPSVRKRCLYELADFITRASPGSYFPCLRPTTPEGQQWAEENKSIGLRCHQTS